jgi:PKD repeat protein
LNLSAKSYLGGFVKLSIVSVLLTGLMSLLVIVATCQHQQKLPACGTVSFVSGTAKAITNNKAARSVTAGQTIQNGESILVGSDSRLDVAFGENNMVSAGAGTNFVVDSLEGAEPFRFPLIHCIDGELFCRTLCQIECDLGMASPLRITTSVEGTRFFFRFVQADTAVVVACLAGIVSVQSAGNGIVEIPSCNKLMVKSNQPPSRLVPTTDADYQRIAKCGGIPSDSLINVSPCVQLHSEPSLAIANKPPEWKNSPRTECTAYSFFRDTLMAIDPQGGPISYSLLAGPKGMLLDSRTGAITFRSAAPATFDVRVSATDTNGTAAATSYTLAVIGKQPMQRHGISAPQAHSQSSTHPTEPQSALPAPVVTTTQPPVRLPSVTLDLPTMAEPGDTVLIDASRSGNEKDPVSSLSFRFDTEGKGIWDMPTSGFTSAKSVTHVFAREGIYKVIAEAKAPDGRIGSAQGTLMVRIPPSASIDIRPPLPAAGTVCTLDARKSTVSGLQPRTFVVRWDLEAKGAWDFPANGSFTSNPLALKTLTGVAPFRVILQIKDAAGLTSKAIAEIPITPQFRIVLLSMPDTVLVARPFTMECRTSYPTTAVAEYDWDLSSRKTFDVKDEKPSRSYEFKTAGVYAISCRAVAHNGNTATATKTVVAVARSVILKAIVPAQVQAMTPVTFDAKIDIHHTSIAKISWDFDGDSIFDWSAQSSPKTKHAYAKPGVYHPVIRVLTLDKHEWRDTASITVTEPLPPKALAGKSILAFREENVDLRGEGLAPGGKIALYEWDFDCDGKYDWSSDKTGSVHHKFVLYGKAVLRVTAENGLTATDTTTIVICPSGMQGIKDGPYCIDKYEYPNKNGQVPVAEVSWGGAQQLCAKEGKRLCTSREWERACEGPDNAQYPTSSSQYQREPCNVLANRDSPNHVVQSGSMGDCASPSGTFDMNGNVAEWTAPEKNGQAFAYGGSWLLPPDKATCSSRLELRSDKTYPFVGFRCCK